MKIKIAAIGKEKSSSPTSQLYNSYIKRIPWKIEFKEFEEKKPLQEAQLIEKEGALLLDVVADSDIVIVLDENGKNLSSKELAGQISKWQSDGNSSFVFLIGGACGHGDKVKKRANLLLSMGKLTWPHMLVRAMLAEQIYRVYTLLTGHPYHRE